MKGAPIIVAKLVRLRGLKPGEQGRDHDDFVKDLKELMVNIEPLISDRIQEINGVIILRFARTPQCHTRGEESQNYQGWYSN